MLSVLQSKKPPQFNCETCKFICSKQSDYNRHIATRKHEMLSNAMCKTESTKKSPQYHCAKCDFTCTSNCDYERHINTNKHKRRQEKPSTIHSCDCGCSYKHYSSYYRHKKTCTYVPPPPEPKKPETSDHSSENPDLYAIIQLLIKENQEIRNLFIDQNKTLTELVKNVQPNNSHNNNTTTNSHNQQNYTINMFLSEKCKDAINMSVLIENVKDKVDMFKIAENGYVDGISKLFIDELKSMEVTERPLHCTDERRSTFYVHNNDTWNKDDDLKDTKQAIGHISQNNLQKCVAWSKNVPEGGSDREEHINKSIRLCKEACSGNDTKVEKIIKNIGKVVPLNKQVMNETI